MNETMIVVSLAVVAVVLITLLFLLMEVAYLKDRSKKQERMLDILAEGLGLQLYWFTEDVDKVAFDGFLGKLHSEDRKLGARIDDLLINSDYEYRENGWYKKEGKTK